MSTEPTPDQRDNLRRTLSFAQDLAHPDWSLSVPHVAKENIRQLLAEIVRLNKTLLDIDSALTERAVTFSGTSLRMGEDMMRPKSERQDPDLTGEDIIRYAAYAAESNAVSHLVRTMIRKLAQ